MPKQKSIGEKELLLRHVRADDCEDIWRWRNDPVVRQCSFSQAEILLSDHRVWFDRRMKDRDTVMYIFENRKGVKLGQVRFQIMPGKTAFISVDMNPQYIGRGFGVYVILEATRTFIKEHAMIGFIRAEILVGNLVSRKVFGKAGYLDQGEELINGQRAIVYKKATNNLKEV